MPEESVKISELAEASPSDITDDDLLVLVDGSETKKATVGGFRSVVSPTGYTYTAGVGVAVVPPAADELTVVGGGGTTSGDPEERTPAQLALLGAEATESAGTLFALGGANVVQEGDNRGGGAVNLIAGGAQAPSAGTAVGGTARLGGGYASSDSGEAYGGDVVIDAGPGDTADGEVKIGTQYARGIVSGSGGTPWTHYGPFRYRQPKVTVSGTSYTLTDDQWGAIVRFTASTDITVEVNDALSEDFWCEVVQGGDGAVELDGSGVILLRPAAFFTRTAGQGSSIVITMLESHLALLRGDMEPV